VIFRISDRLKSLTTDELSALVFRLDIEETVEQLDEVSARLRNELIRELQARE
jgi:Mg/Co/Ni transporter MgtE